MSTNVGSIHYDLELKKDKFDRDSADANRRVDGLKEKFKSAAKSLAIFTAAIAAGGFTIKKGLIDPAIELGESINAVQKTFGEASNKIIEFGKKADVAAGLSKSAFNSAVVPIGAMLQNMGLQQDKAAEESINLARRASDLASVFNTDLGQALTAIQAGLRGEADPLERFGVQMNETAVKAFALEEGLIKQGGEMDATSRATARLGLFYKQTTKFAGDFVDTSDQAANKARIQQARFENLRAEIGEKLLPAYNGLLDFTGNLIDMFRQWWPTIQSVALNIGNLFSQVARHLMPSLQALWNTVSTQLIPVLLRLWNEVLSPIIPVIGVVLVGALKLTIDAINFLLQLLLPLGNWMVNNQPIVLGLAAAVGVLWATMKTRDAINSFMGNFNSAKAGVEASIGGMKKSIGGLNSTLKGFTGWSIFAAAAIGAIAAVMAKFNEMNATINATKAAIASRERSNASALQRAAQQFREGRISRQRYEDIISLANEPVPGFAKGVQNFRGGLAYVHKGELLVDLPRGTSVIPSDAVKSLGNAGGANQTKNVNFNAPIVIKDRADADYLLAQLQRDDEVQSHGMTPVRSIYGS